MLEVRSWKFEGGCAMFGVGWLMFEVVIMVCCLGYDVGLRKGL